ILATSWVRMPIMRSAIPFTSDAHHSFRRSGLFRIAEAIRAPLMGGLEYMGRIRILSWDSTLLASSESLQMTVKAPTRSPRDRTQVECGAKPWHSLILKLIPLVYLIVIAPRTTKSNTVFSAHHDHDHENKHTSFTLHILNQNPRHSTNTAQYSRIQQSNCPGIEAVLQPICPYFYYSYDLLLL
uniref:Uncharacterized protein n=1 Tax=Laticauda laticaudata TaxID=8630 RepID=A0A8C5S7Z5_LATLA